MQELCYDYAFIIFVCEQYYNYLYVIIQMIFFYNNYDNKINISKILNTCVRYGRVLYSNTDNYNMDYNFE